LVSKNVKNICNVIASGLLYFLSTNIHFELSTMPFVLENAEMNHKNDTE